MYWNACCPAIGKPLWGRGASIRSSGYGEQGYFFCDISCVLHRTLPADSDLSRAITILASVQQDATRNRSARHRPSV